MRRAILVPDARGRRSDTTEPLLVLDPIAREQAPVLQNLFQLYAHDFSEVVPVPLQADGRFDVAVGEPWWSEPDHFPYFIRSAGKLVGFALVRQGSRLSGARDVMDVAEMFVARGARGRGVGTRVAHALFGVFPGAWEVRVRPANVGALRFWASALASYGGASVASGPFTIDGVAWDVFQLDSSPA